MIHARHAAALLALALAGCARPTDVANPGEAARASVDARLAGAWRLQRFQPEKPLDAMIQALVDFQANRLVVRFDRGRFVGDGPGVHVDRAYRIVEADGDRFRVVSYDEQGVPYDAVGMFVQPDVLRVDSWSEPWRGVATLARVPPWESSAPALPAPR